MGSVNYKKVQAEPENHVLYQERNEPESVKFNGKFARAEPVTAI